MIRLLAVPLQTRTPQHLQPPHILVLFRPTSSLDCLGRISHTFIIVQCQQSIIGGNERSKKDTPVIGLLAHDDRVGIELQRFDDVFLQIIAGTVAVGNVRRRDAYSRLWKMRET